MPSRCRNMLSAKSLADYCLLLMHCTWSVCCAACRLGIVQFAAYNIAVVLIFVVNWALYRKY